MVSHEVPHVGPPGLLKDAAGRTQQPLGTIPAPELSLSPAKPTDLAATPEEGPGPRRKRTLPPRGGAAPTAGGKRYCARREGEDAVTSCGQLWPSERPVSHMSCLNLVWILI